MTICSDTNKEKSLVINIAQTANNSETYSKDKNLRISKIEERDEVTSKHTHSLFDEVTAKVSPNLEKTKRISILKSCQTTSRNDKRNIHSIL